MREAIAKWLVRIAIRIYPESPEVKDFLMRLMLDKAIYGHSIVRLDPTKTMISGEGVENEQANNAISDR